MTVSLAIVGCGLMTEQTHLPAAALASGVQVTALVDPLIDQAQRLASLHGVGASAMRLVDVADKVDAVLIVTPPHVRVDLVREALGLGLAVLCEKPLANDGDTCSELIELSLRSDRVCAAAHVYRFWDSRIWVRDAVQSGLLGEVRSVSITQGQPYGWKSVSGYSVRKELVPGGVLINAGIHPLDSLLWWFGDAEVLDYRDDAIGGLESNVEATFRFPQVPLARLRMSRTCQLGHMIRIEGSRASIELPTYSRNQLTLREHGESRQVLVGSADASALAPTVAQLEDFAQAIRSSSSARVSFAEASRVVSLVEQCYEIKRSRPLPARAPNPGDVW